MVENKSIFDFLDNIPVDYEKNVKTADLVSLKVGGTARAVVYPKTIEHFCSILEWLCVNKEKYYILCHGTNTYFKDNLYDGIVLSTKYLNKVHIQDQNIIAECGASLLKCCEIARRKSLTGLEFAFGIPGGIGGALYMNASAYEKSISEIISSSVVYDITTKTKIKLVNEQHLFENKNSIFQHKNFIVLSTTLKLNSDDSKMIANNMDETISSRLNKQPCDIPNAGSVFKRPKNQFASKLIDRAGLKGFTIGGASVSTMHAGFIVNTGNATSNDIKELTNYIQNRIEFLFGIKLEKEIIFVE